MSSIQLDMGLWISRDTQHRSLTGSRTSQDGGARVEKTEPSNYVVLKAENPGLPSAGTALASLPSLTPYPWPQAGSPLTKTPPGRCS